MSLMPSVPGLATAHLVLKFPLIAVLVGTVFYASSDGPKSTVVFTFDDSNESDVTIALPVLSNHGFVATSYLTTDLINTSMHMSDTQVMALVDAGWELGGHSINHPYMVSTPETPITDGMIMNNLVIPKGYIERHYGVEVHSFASPYGAYDENLVAMAAMVYDNHANAWSEANGINRAETLDMYNIHRVVIKADTPVDDVCGVIDDLAEDEVFVLAFHTLAEDGEEYTVSTEAFTEIVNCVADAGMTVKTLTDAVEQLNKKE